MWTGYDSMVHGHWHVWKYRWFAEMLSDLVTGLLVMGFFSQISIKVNIHFSLHLIRLTGISMSNHTDDSYYYLHYHVVNFLQREMNDESSRLWIIRKAVSLLSEGRFAVWGILWLTGRSIVCELFWAFRPLYLVFLFLTAGLISETEQTRPVTKTEEGRWKHTTQRALAH